MGFTFAALEQSVEQLLDGLSTAGINRARRNLVEWDQDESALGQPRMGNLKAGLADSEVPYQQDIQVERPGSVEDAGSPVPAKLLFDGQKPSQQLSRLQFCFQRHHGVGEPWLLGESYGIGAVKRRPADDAP
jgi:hypothetical protein